MNLNFLNYFPRLISPNWTHFPITLQLDSDSWVSNRQVSIFTTNTSRIPNQVPVSQFLKSSKLRKISNHNAYLAPILTQVSNYVLQHTTKLKITMMQIQNQVNKEIKKTHQDIQLPQAHVLSEFHTNKSCANLCWDNSC